MGRRIASWFIRFAFHVVVTLALFCALTAIIGVIMDTAWDTLWHDLRPFAGLLLAATAADIAVGVLLQRWVAAAARQAT